MAALSVLALVEQVAPHGHLLRRMLGAAFLGAGICGLGFQ
jgi:predicted metal-binding membrane protein